MVSHLSDRAEKKGLSSILFPTLNVSLTEVENMEEQCEELEQGGESKLCSAGQIWPADCFL